MSEFLVSDNIRRYRALLAGTLDPARRKTIEALLVEEEAKAAATNLEARLQQRRAAGED